MLEPGSLVGDKYRLVAQIGAGGMGVVWKATHEHLGHEIAIKFLTHLGASVEGLVARFLDEARTAAAVRHRNVVHILDFGVTQDQRPYMVMELLEGESLADRLERTPPLSMNEVTQTIALTLSGLAAVHDRGIVHRDIKPENIFLTYDADGFFPKILDFGVSKDLERESDGNRGVRTRDGVLLGTPQYMSPEQARGLRDIDMRTDIYSMGVILYETLAGVRPYDSENVGDILMDVINGRRKSLAEARVGLPPRLVEVVERAMAIDREARFPDAREMRNALFAATAAARTNAFGITDPTGLMSSEVAAAVARVLGAVTPEASPSLPTLESSAAATPAREPALSTPTRLRLPATSVDATIPFRTDDAEAPPSSPSISQPDAHPTPPKAQRRVGRWLAVGLVLASSAGIGVLEVRTPGLVRAVVTRALIRLHDVLPAGPAASRTDGASDGGVPADGGAGASIIEVRLRQLPSDAVLLIDGHAYSASDVDSRRDPDGGVVVVTVPERRELYDIRVEAPGYYPFEGRRYATASVTYRLRMRPLPDAGMDAGLEDMDAGVDAGEVTGDPPTNRGRRRPPRRRR